MYPYLACFSVVFLSQCFQCFSRDNINDVSDDCLKGQIISTYLTSGMGVSDTFVAIIAKEGANCTLNFSVNKENYIIVVVEFLDWFFGKPQCSGVNNEVNVMVRKKGVVNICYEIEENIIRKLGKNELSISVKGEHNLETIKITATSLRVSRNGKCIESEVKCIYEDQVYCMTEASKCDGNVNCGVRNKYDENISCCKNYNAVNPGMVIVGLVIVFVTFCMMVALLKKLVPNREGTFIVKEDETLSEKDRATSEKDFQVKIKLLYDEPGGEMSQADADAITVAIQEQALHRGISFRKTKIRKKS